MAEGPTRKSWHNGSFTISPESSGQTKSPKSSGYVPPPSLPLPHIAPAHNPLFHEDLGCYLGLTHLSLGNVSCADPSMALKALGLWTVHICWGLASRACLREPWSESIITANAHSSSSLGTTNIHIYHSPGRWLKQQRATMCCHGHRRAVTAAVKTTAGFSQNH